MEKVLISSTSSPNLLDTLYTTRAFPDVTLVSEDQEEVAAHRAVLAASSPVLGRLLQRGMGDRQVVFLYGVEGRLLAPLVELLYLGSCRVATSSLPHLLELAARLQVQGMQELSQQAHAKQPWEVVQGGEASQQAHAKQPWEVVQEGEASQQTQAQQTWEVVREEEAFQQTQVQQPWKKGGLEKGLPLQAHAQNPDVKWEGWSSKYAANINQQRVAETISPIETKAIDQIVQNLESTRVPSNTMNHVCDKCGSDFKTLLLLNNHSCLYKCDECPAKFQLENFLKVHITSRHMNNPITIKKTRKRRSDAGVYIK